MVAAGAEEASLRVVGALGRELLDDRLEWTFAITGEDMEANRRLRLGLRLGLGIRIRIMTKITITMRIGGVA